MILMSQLQTQNMSKFLQSFFASWFPNSKSSWYKKQNDLSADNSDIDEVVEFVKMYSNFREEIISEYHMDTEANRARFAIDDNNGTIRSKIIAKISEKFWADDATIDKLISWVITNGSSSLPTISWFMKDTEQTRRLGIPYYIYRPSDAAYTLLQDKFRARGFDFEIVDKKKVLSGYSLAPRSTVTY
jgi:hypothetical protein